jgi:hypothetical protein
VPGVVEAVGDAGHSVMYENDRWHIHDIDGQRVCSMHGKAEALRLCRQLIETGRISR